MHKNLVVQRREAAPVAARESWAEVLTPEGQRGWVNRHYLTPTEGPCPAARR